MVSHLCNDTVSIAEPLFLLLYYFCCCFKHVASVDPTTATTTTTTTTASGGSRIFCLGGANGAGIFCLGGLMGIKRRRGETAIAEGKKRLPKKISDLCISQKN